MKVYITGDKHGNFYCLHHYCRDVKPKKGDVMIILGDIGINYTLTSFDERIKLDLLTDNKLTFFCLNGNHDYRVSNLESYEEVEMFGGTVYQEKSFPRIVFAKNGEVYTINGQSFLTIDGAYSVDKYHRLLRNHKWFEDEQISGQDMKKIEALIDKVKAVDYVLSHTCPFKYIPIETFLSGIDQSTVDNDQEKWLDLIENKVDYKKWYCGHYHTYKKIDKLTFMYDEFEEL